MLKYYWIYIKLLNKVGKREQLVTCQEPLLSSTVFHITDPGQVVAFLLLTLFLLALTCLLINFATILDPDQDRQNVGPYLDPNCLTLIVFLKYFFLKKLIVKKGSR